MHTILGEHYPPTWQGIPRGMSKEDYALWQIYRLTEITGAERLYFNVLLGKGQDAGEGYTEEERKFWRERTQLRADVVVEYPDRVRVVELRVNASVSTIGRTQAYQMLLKDDNPFGKPVETEVVTNTEQAIVREVAERSGVKYTVLKR